MVNYVLASRGYPLSYWFPNNNFYGNIRDIIGFGFSKSWFIFPSKAKALEMKKVMLKDTKTMVGEAKLKKRVILRIKSMKAVKYTR